MPWCNAKQKGRPPPHLEIKTSINGSMQKWRSTAYKTLARARTYLGSSLDLPWLSSRRGGSARPCRRPIPPAPSLLDLLLAAAAAVQGSPWSVGLIWLLRPTEYSYLYTTGKSVGRAWRRELEESIIIPWLTLALARRSRHSLNSDFLPFRMQAFLFSTGSLIGTQLDITWREGEEKSA